MPELKIPDYTVGEYNRHSQQENRPGGEEYIVDKLHRENILMRYRGGDQVRGLPRSIESRDRGYNIRYYKHDKNRQKSQGNYLVDKEQSYILQSAEIIEYPVEEKEAAAEKTGYDEQPHQ
jgi:hypothetical protein